MAARDAGAMAVLPIDSDGSRYLLELAHPAITGLAPLRPLLGAVHQLLAAPRNNGEGGVLELIRPRGDPPCDGATLDAAIGACREVSSLLATAATKVLDTLGASRCRVFRVHEGRLWREGFVERGHLFRREMGESPLGDFPALARAVTDRAIVVPDGQEEDPSDSGRRPLWDEEAASQIVLPIALDDDTQGVICIADDRLRDWGDDLAFLRSARKSIEGALRTVLLVEEVEYRNRVLRHLVQLGELAIQQRDVDALLHSVAERILELLQAADCDIWTLEGDVLRCRVSLDQNGFDEQVVGRSLRPDHYPSTWRALEECRPLVIESLEDPRLTAEELEDYAEFGFQSNFCIPMRAHDRLVGFIDVFDTRPRCFSEFLDVALSVGAIVAGALHNASLLQRLEQRTAENTALLDQYRQTNQDLRLLIDSALEFGSSLDERRVLWAVGERLRTAAGARGCDIYRLDGETLHVLVSIDGGRIDDAYERRSFRLADLGMAAEAIRTRAPVQRSHPLTPDTGTELERRLWEEWKIGASLKLPLIVRGEPVGVISLFDPERREYPNVELLQSLAQTAAQALLNADLYQNLQAKTREAEALNRLAQRTAGTLDAEEVARLGVEELRHLLDFDQAAVVMLQNDGEDRVLFATPLPDGAPQGRAWPGVEQLARSNALEADSRVHIIDVPDDPSGPAPAETRTAAVVALLDNERVLGALHLGSSRQHAYSDSDEGLLTRVGVQLGLALSNARLYEDVKRLHLGNLKALSSALSAKDHYTLGHAARVAAYMVLLGHELGWRSALIAEIEEAAYLHDIGKIAMSDRVLASAGPLNAREWELIRQHPAISAEIMQPLFHADLVLGVRHHHERFDGGGYPDGLSGEGIPLIARAMCVVDSYDAMSYRRPYREPLPYGACLEELRRCSGTQFDPKIVDAFVKVLQRLERRRAVGTAAACAGALAVDPVAWIAADRQRDASSADYLSAAAALRAARDAHPPTRFLTAVSREDDRYVIIVDPEEAPEAWSPSGKEVVGTLGFAEALAGGALDSVVLHVDGNGVWVNAVAPVNDAHGERFGLVCATVPAEAPLTGLEALRSNVKQSFASLLESTAERLGQARQDAVTDYLTGLYSHRYLHERLDEELTHAREHDKRLSLLCIDIDQFKQFNDRHGHSAGDVALRMVAATIESHVRRIDMAARYGGEEFVVVLSETGPDEAMAVAERVRAGVAALQIPQTSSPVSVSIGVSTFPDDAVSKEALIARADQAMHLAKQAGRNGVSSFSAGQLQLDVAAFQATPGDRPSSARADQA